MTNKKDINSRPITENALVSEKMTDIEKFQNKTLRPIIKMKHELIIAYFEYYSANQKFDFADLTELKKIEFIGHSFSKDNHFRNELRGIVMGHFTLEEFKVYKSIIKEANKRILSMVKERILSTLIR